MIFLQVKIVYTFTTNMPRQNLCWSDQVRSLWKNVWLSDINSDWDDCVCCVYNYIYRCFLKPALQVLACFLYKSVQLYIYYMYRWFIKHCDIPNTILSYHHCNTQQLLTILISQDDMYPLIIRMCGNANYPSPWQPSKVVVHKLLWQRPRNEITWAPLAPS